VNREKVTFPPNIPTQVLVDGSGTLQESASGAPEYRYFLEGNRIMWVPPEVHQYIAAALASGSGDQREAFTITKQKQGRTAATWSVQLSQAERPSVTRNGYGTPSPATPPAIEHERTPYQGWIAREQPARSAPQPAAVLAAEAGPELAITAADRMASALRNSIELWAAATTHAKAHGLQLAPNAGDVRATATTLFIAEGGRQ
jgi:hypothetical protein